MPTSTDGILTAEFDPTRGSVLLTIDGDLWPSPVTHITVTRTPVGQPTMPVRGLEMRRVTGGWYIGSDGEMPHDTDVVYLVTGYDSFGNEVRVGRTNLTPDPRLTATTMSLNGSTVTDTRPSTGGPDGGSFFRRTMTTANTTSPMSMPLDGTGTSGIPVAAGQQYTGSWYATKSPPGGPSSRMNVQWYDAAGVLLSTTTGTSSSPAATWARITQTVTAPASAAFATPLLQWSGTALVAQVLELAQAQFETGATATDYLDGTYPDVEWMGATNASASFLPIPTSVTVSTTGAEWGVWLKAPGRVDFNQRVKLADIGGVDSGTQGGTYPVIGGNEVSETSGIGADRAAMRLQTDTAAQDAALKSLLRQYRDIQITTGQPAEIGEGTGADWWHVESHSRSNPGRARLDDYAQRLHTIQIVRQPVPTGVGLVSTGATYSDVSAAYATYTALSAAVSTYADLMNPGV